MKENDNTIKIAMADDHVLLRSALASLINTFDHYEVVFQAGTGKELTELIEENSKVDIVLLDLNMPIMDGFETANWLKNRFPEIHVLMLTMYDSEVTLIRLLQAGVKGFLKKDIHPSELKFALNSVSQYGYYYSHNTTGKLVNLFRNSDDMKLQKNILTDDEIHFLKLAATDLTYKEIALQIELSPRAVDNLRDHLFEKLDVKSRVGLAMYAIRQGLVRF